jgi:hypothetical protein
MFTGGCLTNEEYTISPNSAFPLSPGRRQALVPICAGSNVQPLQYRLNRLQLILQRAQIVEGSRICRSPSGCICSEQPLQSPGKAALGGGLRGGLVLRITIQGSGQNFRNGADDGSVSTGGGIGNSFRIGRQ